MAELAKDRIDVGHDTNRWASGAEAFWATRDAAELGRLLVAGWIEISQRASLTGPLPDV